MRCSAYSTWRSASLPSAQRRVRLSSPPPSSKFTSGPLAFYTCSSRAVEGQELSFHFHKHQQVYGADAALGRVCWAPWSGEHALCAFIHGIRGTRSRMRVSTY